MREIGTIVCNGFRIGSVMFSEGEEPASPPALPDSRSADLGAAPAPSEYGGGSSGLGSRPRHGGDYERGEARERSHGHPGAENIPASEHVQGQFATARERARQELKDKPWLNEKAMHIFAGENPDPAASTALWESAINRAAVRGTTLEQELRRHASSGKDEGGYYAGWRDNVSEDTRKTLERSRDRALAGSNISNYATDNSSGDRAAREIRDGTFKHRSEYNREHFFAPGSAEPRFRNRWEDMVYGSEAARAANPSASPSAPAIEGETPRGSANLMHGQYGAPGTNLTRITTPSGMTASVHKDAAESFQGFLTDLEKSGYKIRDLSGHNNRNIAGSSRLSQHAFGNAVDINPDQNPQYGGTNLPANVSDMAAKWGLSWGGDWSSRYRDPMHFEWTGRRPWLDKGSGQTAKAKDGDKMSDASTKPFDSETMAP
jgi:hypothetical protein